MKTLSVRDHLMLRGCDVMLYQVWLSEDTATFPLWGFDGALRGFQQYRPNADKKETKPSLARYFTRTSRPCLWGLETLPGEGVVYVCESVFKAIAAHSAGFNAVSANGSNIPQCLLAQMRLLHNFSFIAVGDNDAAGLKFSKTFGRGFTGPDLDELTSDQIRGLLNGR